MSADPGGLFRCLMVRTEGETENMLIAQRKDTLYLGYSRDYRNVDLRGVPEERIALEEPKAYREYAVFYHRPRQTENLKWDPSLQPEPERKARFQVEQVVVLSDEQFRQFQEASLCDDQSFPFDCSDAMRFLSRSASAYSYAGQGAEQHGRYLWRDWMGRSNQIRRVYP